MYQVLEFMSKAERTRNYIIEKTAPVFNKKGYAGTSINDLTEATGLTKGSIYGNFLNKDQVALAAFDYNLGKIKAVILRGMKTKKSVKEKLMVYVEVYKDFLIYPFPDGGCPILNTATEADDTHPDLKEKAHNAILEWKASLAELVEAGKKDGEIKSEVNAERFALTLIATLEGAVMIAMLTGKLNYRNMIMKSVEENIMAL